MARCCYFVKALKGPNQEHSCTVLKQSQVIKGEKRRSGSLELFDGFQGRPKSSKSPHFLPLTSNEEYTLLLRAVNAAHAVFMVCGPLEKTVAALSGFLCLGRRFLVIIDTFIIF